MLLNAMKHLKRTIHREKKTVFGMPYFDVLKASTTLVQLVYKVTPFLYFYQQFSNEAD